MNVRPLHDGVLIKRLEEEKKTKGGIIIPDNVKEKPAEGIVKAVGVGLRNSEGNFIPMSVKINDKVMFGKWAGTEVKISEEEFLLIKESEILCVIE